jgi:hypothetical protein
MPQSARHLAAAPAVPPQRRIVLVPDLAGPPWAYSAPDLLVVEVTGDVAVDGQRIAAALAEVGWRLATLHI